MGQGSLRRGDVVVVAAGKPRPSVVVQADAVPTARDVLICPFTTHLLDAPMYRIAVEPDGDNGLKAVSQIMIDKVGPVPRDKIGGTIGRLTEADMGRVDTALIVMLDLAGG